MPVLGGLRQVFSIFMPPHLVVFDESVILPYYILRGRRLIEAVCAPMLRRHEETRRTDPCLPLVRFSIVLPIVSLFSSV